MSAQYAVNYREERMNTINENDIQNSRKRGIFFLKFITTLICVFVLSVLYLWQLSNINFYKTEISKCNIEQKSLNQNINNLNVIIAKLSSFERIKGIAEEELGMVKSTEIEYIEVKGLE